ncbi:MAG: hypothetical protein M9962_01610 [Oligoflexia bacterium]|nr:hypothetical protein [Oligoflexia bacterium]
MSAARFFRLFFLLIYALTPSLTYTENSYANPTSCQEEYANLKIAQQIVDTLTFGSREFSIDRLIGNEKFAKFLQEKKIVELDALSINEQKKILEEYAASAFSSYRSKESLTKMRALSLQKQSRLRGSTQIKDFASASRINTKRILENLKVPDTPEMIELKKIFEEIETFFVHHTNFDINGRNLEAPLLSSRQLEEIGLGRGLNSQNHFNRDIIQSDDNVFFFVSFKKKSVNALDMNSNDWKYGTERIYLDKSFARENGWISYFMMYPDQFLSYLRKYHPELIPKLENAIETKLSIKLYDINLKTAFANLRADQWNTLNEAEPELVSKLLGSLHTMDFTVDDFEKVWKAQALHKLYEILQSDPKEFQRILSEFKSSDPEISVRPLEKDHLIDSFEMKIPVAIEPTNVTYKSSET